MPNLENQTFESPTLKWVFGQSDEKPGKDDLGRTAVALIEADAKLTNVILDAKRLIEETEANQQFIRKGLSKINAELNG